MYAETTARVGRPPQALCLIKRVRGAVSKRHRLSYHAFDASDEATALPYSVHLRHFRCCCCRRETGLMACERIAHCELEHHQVSSDIGASLKLYLGAVGAVLLSPSSALTSSYISSTPSSRNSVNTPLGRSCRPTASFAGKASLTHRSAVTFVIKHASLVHRLQIARF